MRKRRRRRLTKQGKILFRTLALVLLVFLGVNVISKEVNLLQAKRTNISTPQSIVKEDKKEEKSDDKKNNHILNVPFIQQLPELQRGCEVTSLAMLLNFAGVEISKMELAEKIEKVPFRKDGYIGDMNEGFLGDIYSFENPGLGVYVKPVFRLANQILPGKIVNLTDKPVKELYKMVDKGSPVWVITNSRFRRLPESEYYTFETINGTMKVTYKEHSVVITGYNDDYVYINDPLAQEPNTKVERKNFEEAWIQMGRQAIGLKY